MNVSTWSLVWQVVAAGACLSFFGLAALISRGAIRDAADMFRDLATDRDSDQETIKK